MHINCLSCGCQFSLDAALSNAAAREAVITALKLPAPLGEHVVKYIALFRSKTHSLAWERVARLLNELLKPIESGQLMRNKKVYPAPLDYWMQGVEIVINNRNALTLPLKTHGYLFTIVAGLSDKQQGAAELQSEKSKINRIYPYVDKSNRSDPTTAQRYISDALSRIKEISNY